MKKISWALSYFLLLLLSILNVQAQGTLDTLDPQEQKFARESNLSPQAIKVLKQFGITNTIDFETTYKEMLDAKYAAPLPKLYPSHRYVEVFLKYLADKEEGARLGISANEVLDKRLKNLQVVKEQSKIEEYLSLINQAAKKEDYEFACMVANKAINLAKNYPNETSSKYIFNAKQDVCARYESQKQKKAVEVNKALNDFLSSPACIQTAAVKRTCATSADYEGCIKRLLPGLIPPSYLDWCN